MAFDQNERLLAQLRSTFLVESRDHLDAISNALLRLEGSAADGEVPLILELALRAAHSLKGAARSVDLRSIESLCQSLEDVLAKLRNRTAVPSTGLLDTMHRALTAISGLVDAMEQPSGEATVLPDLPALRADLARQLEDVGEAPSPQIDVATEAGRIPMESQERPREGGSSWVRVALTKLESNLLEVEELRFARISARQRAAELRDLLALVTEWRRRTALVMDEGRRPAAQGRSISAFTDHLAWSEGVAQRLEARLGATARQAVADLGSLSKTIDSVQSTARQLLHLPFDTLIRPFPKLVRDLARQQGKDVELQIIGGAFELDRRIIEGLRDPLIHLIRNAVDHGAGGVDRRKAEGKAPRTTVVLSAEITDRRTLALGISDDGSGIDEDSLRRSVVDAGLLSAREAETMDTRLLYPYIFGSGVTTRSEVTALSGRGLGLAIVQDRISMLGGDVAVESEPGRGTTFRMELPVTRSDDRGVLFRSVNRLFLIPLRSVHHVGRMGCSEVRIIDGFETVSLMNRVHPLIRMKAVLGLASDERGKEGSSLIVTASGQHNAALLVDEVLGEQDVIIKPIPAPLDAIPYIDGVSVMGTGVVVPVVNVRNLLRSIRRLSATDLQSPDSCRRSGPRGKILLADDSITSRLLLKAVLESGGHVVQTAVDGLDAYQQLLTYEFSALVSDVDMPKLDGLALTARVRSNHRLVSLPVILVSARDSPEERQRGLEAGANAYLGKREFDQRELLRLVGELA